MGNKQGGLTHDGGQPYATNEVVGTAFPSPPSPISPGDIGGPKEYERKSVTGTPSQIAMQRRLSMSIAEFAKQLDTGPNGLVWNMKIAIRGDIGTGKSSLLHVLLGRAPGSNTNNVNTSILTSSGSGALPVARLPSYTPTPEIQSAKIRWAYKSTNETVMIEVWDVVDRAIPKLVPATSLPKGHPALNIPHDHPGASPLGRRSATAGMVELPGTDVSNVDVYKGVSAVIIMVDPRRLASWHYAVTILSTAPQDIDFLLVFNFRDQCHGIAGPFNPTAPPNPTSAQSTPNPPSETSASTTTTSVTRPVTREQVNSYLEDMKGKRSVRCIDMSLVNGFGLRQFFAFLNLPYLRLRTAFLQQQLQFAHEETNASTIEFSLLLEQGYEGYAELLRLQQQAAQRPQPILRATSASLSLDTPPIVPHSPTSNDTAVHTPAASPGLPGSPNVVSSPPTTSSPSSPGSSVSSPSSNRSLPPQSTGLKYGVLTGKASVPSSSSLTSPTIGSTKGAPPTTAPVTLLVKSDDDNQYGLDNFDPSMLFGAGQKSKTEVGSEHGKKKGSGFYSDDEDEDDQIVQSRNTTSSPKMKPPLSERHQDGSVVETGKMKETSSVGTLGKRAGAGSSFYDDVSDPDDFIEPEVDQSGSPIQHGKKRTSWSGQVIKQDVSDQDSEGESEEESDGEDARDGSSSSSGDELELPGMSAQKKVGQRARKSGKEGKKEKKRRNDSKTQIDNQVKEPIDSHVPHQGGKPVANQSKPLEMEMEGDVMTIPRRRTMSVEREEILADQQKQHHHQQLLLKCVRNEGGLNEGSTLEAGGELSEAELLIIQAKERHRRLLEEHEKLAREMAIVDEEVRRTKESAGEDTPLSGASGGEINKDKAVKEEEVEEEEDGGSDSVSSNQLGLHSPSSHDVLSPPPHATLIIHAIAEPDVSSLVNPSPTSNITNTNTASSITDTKGGLDVGVGSNDGNNDNNGTVDGDNDNHDGDDDDDDDELDTSLVAGSTSSSVGSPATMVSTNPTDGNEKGDEIVVDVNKGTESTSVTGGSLDQGQEVIDETTTISSSPTAPANDNGEDDNGGGSNDDNDDDDELDGGIVSSSTLPPQEMPTYPTDKDNNRTEQTNTTEGDLVGDDGTRTHTNVGDDDYEKKAETKEQREERLLRDDVDGPTGSLSNPITPIATCSVEEHEPEDTLGTTPDQHILSKSSAEAEEDIDDRDNGAPTKTKETEGQNAVEVGVSLTETSRNPEHEVSTTTRGDNHVNTIHNTTSNSSSDNNSNNNNNNDDELDMGVVASPQTDPQGTDDGSNLINEANTSSPLTDETTIVTTEVQSTSPSSTDSTSTATLAATSIPALTEPTHDNTPIETLITPPAPLPSATLSSSPSLRPSSTLLAPTLPTIGEANMSTYHLAGNNNNLDDNGDDGNDDDELDMGAVMDTSLSLSLGATGSLLGAPLSNNGTGLMRTPEMEEELEALGLGREYSQTAQSSASHSMQSGGRSPFKATYTIAKAPSSSSSIDSSTDLTSTDDISTVSGPPEIPGMAAFASSTHGNKVSETNPPSSLSLDDFFTSPSSSAKPSASSSSSSSTTTLTNISSTSSVDSFGFDSFFTGASTTTSAPVHATSTSNSSTKPLTTASVPSVSPDSAWEGFFTGSSNTSGNVSGMVSQSSRPQILRDDVELLDDDDEMEGHEVAKEKKKKEKKIKKEKKEKKDKKGKRGSVGRGQDELDAFYS